MAEALRRSSRSVSGPRAITTALAAAILAYVIAALWVARGTTIFVDEVELFINDRGLRPSALLSPLNGHLVFFERLVYALSFKLVGPSWLPAQLGQVLAQSVVVALVFVLVRRRVGATAGFGGALLVLVFGTAWELNWVVSGIGNTWAVAAGLGAFLCLEREDQRGDVLACALLTVAVASFTIGVAFVAGGAALLVLRDRTPSRAWIVMLPIGLWLAWLLWVRLAYAPHHPGTQSVDLSNLLVVPAFYAEAAGSLAGAVAGLNVPFEGGDLFAAFSTRSSFGPTLAVVAVAALVLHLRRGYATPWVWATLVTLGVFWLFLALGLGPGRSAAVARYTYGGSIIALLVAAEAFRGARPSRTVLVVMAGLLMCSLLGQADRLHDGLRLYRDSSLGVRSRLAGLEVAADVVAPGYQLRAGLLQIVPAGPYLAAVDRIGSPAYTAAELLRRPEPERAAADAALVAAERVAVAPTTSPAGGCRRLTGAAAATVVVTAPGAVLRSDLAMKVAVRRFAAEATTRVGDAAGGVRTALPLPADRSRRPWVVTLTPSPAALTVCPLR